MKTWTLDTEPCDLTDLLDVNDFPSDVVAAINGLDVGQTLTLGGGAGADFLLRRES